MEEEWRNGGVDMFLTVKKRKKEKKRRVSKYSLVIEKTTAVK